MSPANEFDKFADSYDADMARAIDFCGQEHEYFTRRKVEELVDLARRRLGDPATLTMLDVGCGVGATDALLAPHVGALHGVDPAAEAVERAAVANPTVTYRAYDGKRLPYEDASVDVAFAICVMHHVDVSHRPQFAAELQRVVRPGGLAVVFEHNPYNPLTQRVVRNCEFDEGVVLLNRRTVQRFLRGAGLEPVEARFVIFSPYDKRWVPGLERRIGWLPAGAQHYVAARR
jgi:SAM-dependent methyltransferase